MSPRLCRPAAWTGALAAGLLLGLAAEPASAAETVADIDDLSRVERIAAELEESPVFVHHTMADPGLTSAVEDLRGRVASDPLADLEVHVVFYPSVPADETGGHPSLFLHALHEESGRDGVYVAVTSDGRVSLATFDSPVEPPRVDPDSLNGTHLNRADTVLDLLEAAPQGPEASSGLIEDLPPDPADAVPRPSGSAEEFWSAVLFPGALIGVVLVGVRLRIGGPSTWRPLRLRLPRQGKRRAASVAYQVRWAPHRTRRWWLRPVLSHELRRLRRRIERAPADHPRGHEALRTYDAAGLIARSPSLPDQAWVCAIVVARGGVHLVDHPDLPLLAPCQVNALHGPAIHRRSDPRTRGRGWWVCARCARRWGATRFGPPRVVLTISTRQGPVPFRSAGRDVWARAVAEPGAAPARILKELEV